MAEDTIYPGQSSDDGEVRRAFSLSTSGTTARNGRGGGASEYYEPMWRFIGNIPSGSTINSAYLHVYVDSVTNPSTITSNIQFEKTSSPATFSTLANYNARSWTTNAVSKNFTGVSAGWFTSPNLDTELQEVVDAHGDLTNLVVRMYVTGSGDDDFVYFRTYDYTGSTYDPYLVVNYDAPATGGVPLATMSPVMMV